MNHTIISFNLHGFLVLNIIRIFEDTMLKQFKNKIFYSERLMLSPIDLKDAAFVLELFNTSGWLKYIGDRNIHSVLDAENFIKNACSNTNAMIWTMRFKEETSLPIGIITFIKREYLTVPDVGYALLPSAMNLGFAFEATKATIDEIRACNLFEKLHAITLPNNLQSINLLKKLKFKFDTEILTDELLHLYNYELT